MTTVVRSTMARSARTTEPSGPVKSGMTVTMSAPTSYLKTEVFTAVILESATIV